MLKTDPTTCLPAGLVTPTMYLSGSRLHPQVGLQLLTIVTTCATHLHGTLK
jgi:hypothetical protein